MPRTKQKETTQDVFRGIASKLRGASTRPNLYGYQPHNKQYQFHRATNKGKLFLGGNRSGKTVGGAVEAIWWAAGSHPLRSVPEPPTRHRIVGVDFLNGTDKIVKPEIARWMPPSYLINGSWEDSYDKEHRTLTFSNESFIEFMSYDQELDAFAGTSRHTCWFDEEPPKSIWQECLARLIDTGGSWWITMTPIEGMTWVFDDIYEDPLQRYLVIQVEMSENPHTGEAEREEYLSGLNKDERKAREKGEFVAMGGIIYTHFNDRNILPPIVPNKLLTWIGMMDHGYNNPTAWLFAQIDSDGNMVVFDEHYESKMLVADHAAFVLKKFDKWERPTDYNVGDPSIRNIDPITGTSVLLEYQEHGVDLMLGNNDVVAGIQRVARYIGHDKLRPKLYITENCTRTLGEIRKYRWSQWASRKMREDKNVKEEPHKKNDHAMDALRYGIASRPEHDAGTVQETLLGPMGYPSSVDPDNRKDEGLLVLSNPKIHADYHLGEEY